MNPNPKSPDPSAEALAASMAASRSGVLIWLALTSTSACAYVDGGTGLILVQGLIALIGGLIFFFKHPIRTIKSWLRRFKRRSGEE